MANEHVLRDMTVDYVEFYVSDIERTLGWLVDGYRFVVRAGSVPDGGTSRSVNLGQGEIDLLLTCSAGDDPVRGYTERHGDGVADIGLRVPDAAGAFTEAVRRGARPVAEPVTRAAMTTASIVGFGDVTHTFVQRPDGSTVADLRGLVPASQDGSATGVGLAKVDHFAACVEAGRLDEAVGYYQRVLDFDLVLSERIVTGDQAMFVKAVQSKSRAVTLTLVEADTSLAAGQIEDFLKSHDGPGVQHLAFSTGDILGSVRALIDRGVELLPTPAAYYTTLADRVRPVRHTVEQLRELSILIDQDHDGQLYQIFAKSVHPRKTIFLEIIERAGATTFGSSNIKNLYDAVEAERNHLIEEAR